MQQSPIISTLMPKRWQVGAALVTMAILLLAACMMLPIAKVGLPPVPGFMPAFGAMMFLAALITAALLFSQARAARDRSTADLGTAYLFSSMVIVPHLMAFPGVFADVSIIGTSASAVWLWCGWHAGFALCVARYAWRRDRMEAGAIRLVPIVAIVAAIVAVLACIATAGLPYLPLLIVGSSFTSLDTLVVGPVVLLCNLTALLLVGWRLRGRTVTDLWLAVAMVTATLDVALTMQGGSRYTLGWYAARLLSLGTDVTVLVALLAELTSLFRKISGMNAHLQALSITDGLTSLTNRRGFDDALGRAWATAQREETAISLLMIDIDHFKGFNDTYGHPAGDECLRRVASMLASHARRPYDSAARLGGEEFVLMMPATEEAGAAIVAERLRRAIETLMIPHQASRLGHVTISGGLATMRPRPRQDSAILTEIADQALYRAKTGGRNRICAAEGAAATFDVVPMPSLRQVKDQQAPV